MTHCKLRAITEALSGTGEIHIVLTVDQACKLCAEHDALKEDIISAANKCSDSNAEIARLHRIIAGDRNAHAADRYSHRKYRELSEAFLLAYLESHDASEQYRITRTDEAWERAAKARQELGQCLTRLLDHTYVKAKVMP